MQGSTPQKKLFELMEPQFKYGTSEARSVYDKRSNVDPYSKALTLPASTLQSDAWDLMGGYGEAGGRAEDLAYGAENTMLDALRGGTGYTGTQEQDILAGKIPAGPYNQMADAFTQQSQQSMLDNLAAARTGIVENQAGGSPIGNRVQARAISDNQKDINARLAGMNLGAFQTAQAGRDPLARLMAQQQQAGMQMYPSIASQPMKIFGTMGGAGEQQRAVEQGIRQRDIDEYARANLQQQNALTDYLGGLGTLGGQVQPMLNLLET